jgi:hypothetical protein
MTLKQSYSTDLNIGMVYSPNEILFSALFLGTNVVVHLTALIVFIAVWWDQTRKRDVIWES